jgi:hypothetical protein
VAVQDAQRPRGQHEHAGHGEDDAREQDGDLALFAAEAGQEHADQHRRHDHAEQRQSAGHGEQQGEDGAGQRPAASVVARSSSREYTGMNDALSVPSPSRFCSTLGMRSAPRNADAYCDVPR